MSNIYIFCVWIWRTGPTLISGWDQFDRLYDALTRLTSILSATLLYYRNKDKSMTKAQMLNMITVDPREGCSTWEFTVEAWAEVVNSQAEYVNVNPLSDLQLAPEGRPGTSDVFTLSGISGLSFDDPHSYPVLFYCQVLFHFPSCNFSTFPLVHSFLYLF